MWRFSSSSVGKHCPYTRCSCGFFSSPRQYAPATFVSLNAPISDVVATCGPRHRSTNGPVLYNDTVATPPSPTTESSPVSAATAVDPDAVCRIGGVRIRLVGRERGTGIVGWSLRGLASDQALDGIPTSRSDTEVAAPAEHANGAVSVDHVVLLSPDLDRTVASLGAAGAYPRRERDAELGGRPIRQVFFRMGEVIIEVVGTPGSATPGPSTLWGITFAVADIDATAAYFGGRTAPVKDAVQPGRRITTLRHQEFGMSVRTALISYPLSDGR